MPDSAEISERGLMLQITELWRGLETGHSSRKSVLWRKRDCKPTNRLEPAWLTADS